MSADLPLQDNSQLNANPVPLPQIEVRQVQVPVNEQAGRRNLGVRIREAVKIAFQEVGAFFVRFGLFLRNLFRKEQRPQENFRSQEEIRQLADGAGNVVAPIIQETLSPLVDEAAERVAEVVGGVLPRVETPLEEKIRRVKVPMQQVALNLCGQREESLVPQVSLYLKRAAKTMAKITEENRSPFFVHDLNPPIYYGKELTLPEGATIEQAIEEAIEIFRQADISGFNLFAEQFLAKAIRNLYGVDREISGRPQVIDYHDQAEALTSLLIEDISPNILIGQSESTLYLTKALEFLLSDRVNPPRNRAPVEINIPAAFEGNKEAFYQSIISQWIEKMPAKYKKNLQLAVTHQYLYQTLVQLFGKTTDLEREVVKERTNLIVNGKFDELLSGGFTLREEDMSKAINDGEEFFKRISNSITTHLTTGRSLECFPYEGEPLTIAPLGWGSYLSRMITFGNRSNTDRLNEQANLIYNEIVGNLGGNFVLTLAQRDELLYYIRSHLSQAYGEDRRYQWGTDPDTKIANSAKLYNNVLSPRIDLNQLNISDEEESDLQLYLGKMIEEVSKMPLGQIPKVPDFNHAPLPLLVYDYEIDPFNPTDSERDQIISGMATTIMKDLGNPVDRATTHRYLCESLAKLFNVELVFTRDDMIRMCLEKGVKYTTGWDVNVAAKLIRPAFEAVVEDVKDNTSALVSTLGQNAISRIHQREIEALEQNSSLANDIVNDRILPGLVRRLDGTIVSRNSGNRLSVAFESLPEDEKNARKEYVSNLIMKLMLPNGPQDITPFQPASLEAIPEVDRLISLLNKLEFLAGDRFRDGLGINALGNLIQKKTDSALRYLMSLSEGQLDDLGEHSESVKEALQAAIQVYRKGGENVHARAYQVMLYTILQRTIENSLLNDLLKISTDPLVQRQRLINLANLLLQEEEVEGNVQEEQRDAEQIEPRRANLPNIRRTNYEEIGKRLFDLFIGHNIQNERARKFAKNLITRKFAKMTATTLNGCKVENLVKTVFSEAVKDLSTQAAPQQAVERPWWNPIIPEGATEEQLEHQLSEVVNQVKDKMIGDWKAKGVLHQVALGLGLSVVENVFDVDRNLEELVLRFVRDTLDVMNKLASEDSVLTLLERTLEDLTKDPQAS